MTEPLLVERRGPVAVLTLNRPEALNALDRSLLEALSERIGGLASDTDLRAVVITGAGRAFSAGADVEFMRGLDPRSAEAFSRLGHETFAALEALDAVTIAAVNGYALGGGCELALACDWIYASSRARFGQPEVRLGLIPGFGGTTRLPRRVGLAWAKELVLGGERIDAETAERIGLVNRVFEPEGLLPAAVRAAEAVAQGGPLAVAHAKRLLQESQEVDVRSAHFLEQQTFALVFASEDRREGIEAFLAKRPARFRGR